jgi:hypothetical protein
MKYRLWVARPSMLLLLLVLVGSLLAPSYRANAQRALPPAKPTETNQGPKIETRGNGTKKDGGLTQPTGSGPVQSLAGTFDVGVIPATRSCPANTEAIVINMDDEDDNNADVAAGWIGATVSNRNTSFFFCRVNGLLLRPLTTQFTATQFHYAVLKLGSQCPNGSLDFARGFDNEDDANANSFSGNIAPNVSNRNTGLAFCLFRSGTTIMSAFPNLGFSYGVFAASTFSRQLAWGFVHTDDEDNANENSYSANAAWSADAQRIVSAGPNTTLNMVRVR